MTKNLLICIFLFIYSCNSCNSKQKDPLVNTCWALTVNNFYEDWTSEIDVDTVTPGDLNNYPHYKFKEKNVLVISGLKYKYKFKNHGFYLQKDFYQITEFDESYMKVIMYEKDRYPCFIHIFHRINCNDIN